ncbi:unnamed protein product [Allacma fusca]|uniref:Uncharacterized protein n=1 Tax=Allacma fusca TaxID=39272 RepID=A0A8J2K7S5_9HEXA|nr:unnamed protein product [Allacma fusca]
MLEGRYNEYEDAAIFIQPSEFPGTYHRFKETSTNGLVQRLHVFVIGTCRWAKLHVQPMDAGSSSQETQEESVDCESFLQHNEEVIPHGSHSSALDVQREEARTERRSRIQRESRKTEKGKLKMKLFKAKKRSEHRPRKRDQKK